MNDSSLELFYRRSRSAATLSSGRVRGALPFTSPSRAATSRRPRCSRWMMPLLTGILVLSNVARASDNYSDTIDVFKQAGASANFFRTAYAYAVFPTIGEGGFIVGAALGKGRVYLHRRWVGDSKMTQLSAGFQAGGKAYSQIIFFENKQALDKFQTGSFEFAGGASATAITANAGGSVGTSGATANASGTRDNATTGSLGYLNGMAVFSIAKGGLMFAATLSGQKYSYEARGSN